MLTLLRASVAAAVLCSGAHAQTFFDDSAIQARLGIYRENIGYIVQTELIGSLPAWQHEGLSDVRVRVAARPMPDEKGNLASAFSYNANPRTRELLVSVETLMFWGQLALVHTWMIKQGCDQNFLWSYILQASRAKGEFPGPLEAFDLSEARLLRYPDVDQESLKVTNTLHRFALAHELGHLYYHHSGELQPLASQTAEAEADDFAMDVLAHVHLPPLGADLFFTVLRFVDPPERDRPFSTHPPTPERMAAIARRIRSFPDPFVRQDAADFQHQRDLLLTLAVQFDALAGHLARPMQAGGDRFVELSVEELPVFYPMEQMQSACPD